MYRHESVISASPRGLISGSGIQLGKSVTGKPVSLDYSALERHLLILGKTGTGKSNLLIQIVREIILSKEGSVVVFDPHGRLGKAITSLLPEETTVITPKQVESNNQNLAIQLNAISVNKNDTSGQLAASWVKDAFSNEGVFSQGTWGPRLEVVFTSVLNEIIESRENANLGDLLELLTDLGKMRRFITNLHDPDLKSFLKMQIADWRGWNQYASSSINKLLPLLTNSGIRNLISSREDSVNLSSLLKNNGKVVVPEIWRDAVPEETYKIITVLILLKIWLGRLAQKENNPLYLVFDEAQLVPPRILDRLLREGRKFGLRVIMATQFLGSGFESLSETLRGNVSNVVGFSLFEKDAHLVSSNFFSGKIAEKLSGVLKSQSIHRSVVWSQGLEGISGPLSFIPDLNDADIEDEVFHRIRDQSVKIYGSPKEEVANRETYSDLHEFLISEFQKFLEVRSIEFDRNVAFDGIYPDLFFSFNARTFFVEVEVSDLTNFGRIWKKVLDYQGRPLVFLTPPGYAEDLFNGILLKLSGVETVEKNSSDLLSLISIVEYDKGFHFFASGKLRQLRISQLKEGSFTRSISELRHSEVRNFVYAKMIRNHSYRIEFPYQEVGKTFGTGNASNAWAYLCGGSNFITVKDLFRVKSSDSKNQ